MAEGQHARRGRRAADGGAVMAAIEPYAAWARRTSETWRRRAAESPLNARARANLERFADRLLERASDAAPEAVTDADDPAEAIEALKARLERLRPYPHPDVRGLMINSGPVTDQVRAALEAQIAALGGGEAARPIERIPTSATRPPETPAALLPPHLCGLPSGAVQGALF